MQRTDRISGRRRCAARHLLYRALLVALAPLAFLALLEAALALTGSYPPGRLLLETTQAGSSVLYTNPDFGRSFLPRQHMPVPSPVWVSTEKKQDVSRVVLIGASAAAGFPNPEFNLARFVEATWNRRHPDRPVEVINLTMVAVNSHILRLFAREAMRMSPDPIPCP